MTAKTIATAVNKNSLDTLSTLEAPKERRTSWYLKGLPGWRAAELTRSPAETSRNPSLWHAITGPGTDVCCCVISINGVLAGIAVTVAVATAVTYSSQMLFVFICQHATSSPSPSQRCSLHVCFRVGCCTKTTRIGSQSQWKVDAHFGYPTVPMPSSSAFAAVIPEPISNDDFHDDDAAANDRERVPLPSEPVLVIDQCKDPGPGTKHQGPWQQEAGPASSDSGQRPPTECFHH
ncbi:GD12808 [Drosophila simulans]|uniref:GD12808 n=1 Tax=Drosophila simulans TaxID=7240 RepID=B4QQ54_DROSI|nr:GD12808 [Drosophila simulans]